MIIFSREADRTLTDRVTTAWGRAATGEGHTDVLQHLQQRSSCLGDLAFASSIGGLPFFLTSI
jgi:hypothetical protein